MRAPGTPSALGDRRIDGPASAPSIVGVAVTYRLPDRIDRGENDTIGQLLIATKMTCTAATTGAG